MNKDARVPFGIPRLDVALSGGLVPGSSTLVAGCLGSGKTMLGMHLLLNASARRQQGLYLSFAGDPETMVVSREGIGAQFREQVEKKSILLHAGDNFSHREGLARLKSICHVRKVRVAMLDGLHYVNMAQYSELTGLLALLNGLGITVLLAYGLSQRATELDAPAEQMGFYCDTLLMLFRSNLRDAVNRQVAVLKMRGSAFRPARLSFAITPDGIVVAKNASVRSVVQRGRENVQVYFPFSFFGEKWAAYFRRAGELLRRKYPGIVCTVINENTINLRQLLAARESDVVLALVPLDGLPGLARRGLLMKLDEVLPLTTREAFVERTLAGCCWQNTLWAVPRFIDRQVILYNKKLVKKHGFEPPHTWDDLLRQAETITDREKDPDLVGCLVPFDASGLPFLFIEYLWSLGKDLFLPRDTQHHSLIRALMYLRKLLAQRNPQLSPQGAPWNAVQQYNHFFNGKAVFVYASVDACCSTRLFSVPPDMAYGVTWLSGQSGPDAAFMVKGTGLAIPANTRFPELAGKILPFFTDYPLNARLHTSVDFVAGMNAYKKYYTHTPRALRPLAFAHQLAAGRFLSELEPYFYDVRPVIHQELLSVIVAQRDPERAGQRIKEQVAHHWRKKKLHTGIDAAVAYIEANYHTDLTLPGVAGMVHISPNHLNRLFKEAQGCSCMDFAINLRIERARDLLTNTDYRVNEIARLVGYDNPYYFSRLFKKRTGASPAFFRRTITRSK